MKSLTLVFCSDENAPGGTPIMQPSIPVNTWLFFMLPVVLLLVSRSASEVVGHLMTSRCLKLSTLGGVMLQDDLICISFQI